MEMCYDGALVMPKNYAVVSEDEMTYIDGGAMAWYWKAAIIAGVVVAGVALAVALAYGQVGLVAKIMGLTIRAAATDLGVKGVATIVAGATGVSVAACTSVISAVVKL